MSKEALIDRVVEKTGMTKKSAKEAVNAVFDGIAETLAEGGEVSIIGFGKFSTKQVAERTGRNPQTGKEMVINAHKKVQFSVGKGLKDKVNH